MFGGSRRHRQANQCGHRSRISVRASRILVIPLIRRRRRRPPRKTHDTRQRRRSSDEADSKAQHIRVVARQPGHPTKPA
ncbi:hypothetical protein COL922a_002654 [Colletotrichum nupharicola]|nr:hypothetical protein COL922a_002654 [Colletotrichum nupharicola]